MATGGGGTTGSFERSFIPPFRAPGCRRDSLTGNTTLPSRPETCYQAPAFHPRPDLWAPLLHGSRNHLVRERLPSGAGTTALRGLSRGGSNGRGGSTLCGCPGVRASCFRGHRKTGLQSRDFCSSPALGHMPCSTPPPQKEDTCFCSAHSRLQPLFRTAQPHSEGQTRQRKGSPRPPRLCLSPCPWPRPPSNLTAPLPALPASLLAARPCAALQGLRGLGASHFCSLNVASSERPSLTPHLTAPVSLGPFSCSDALHNLPL